MFLSKKNQKVGCAMSKAILIVAICFCFSCSSGCCQRFLTCGFGGQFDASHSAYGEKQALDRLATFEKKLSIVLYGFVVLASQSDLAVPFTEKGEESLRSAISYMQGLLNQGSENLRARGRSFLSDTESANSQQAPTLSLFAARILFCALTGLGTIPSQDQSKCSVYEAVLCRRQCPLAFINVYEGKYDSQASSKPSPVVRVNVLDAIEQICCLASHSPDLFYAALVCCVSPRENENPGECLLTAYLRYVVGKASGPYFYTRETVVSEEGAV